MRKWTAVESFLLIVGLIFLLVALLLVYSWPQ